MAFNDLTPEELALFASEGTPVTSVPVTGNETTAAPAGNETTAAPGNDTLSGGANTAPAGGNDTLSGATGNDVLSGQQQMVPHAALHEARQRLSAVQQTNSQLMARLNAILAARQGAGQQTHMPSIQEDPAGYFQALEERLARFENARNQETENQEVDGRINSDEAMFAAQRPDYPQAAEYWVASRARELLQFNPPEVAQKILQQESRQIAQESWKRGMPFAATLYQIAQARGYAGPSSGGGQGAAPASQGAPAAPQGGPAGAQGSGVTPQGTLNPADIIRAMQQGQAAGSSLSGAPGAATPATMNAEAVLGMSDAEFEVWMTRNKGADFAAIAGG